VSENDRPDIRELDAATVERIAAGEVVERPASAVKELVENGLDAGAGRIEVEVSEGGREGVRVRDDGHGMTEQEVRRAVREHTTSKITGVDDLDALSTLGFRGEALHAIGAVSRTTIRTRPPGGQGTELRIEGGEVPGVAPVGCPEGTSVEVEDLFYNVPARRRYLKQPATEFDHVARVVTGYALANPDVAVALSNDGREQFATPGRGDLRGAVLATYGREVARAMIEVDHEPEGPLERVHGLVSHPETNRASREYLSTFVNGRYVTADVIRQAIVEAYGSQLGDRYPFAVLFVGVDPAAVDANVHPRKLEVRFADEEGVRASVRGAVEDALLCEGLVRSGAPRGASAPDETDVAPGRGEGATGETTDAEPEGGSGDVRGEEAERRAPGESRSTGDDGRAAGTTGGSGDASGAGDTAAGSADGEPTSDGRAGDRDGGGSDPTVRPDADRDSGRFRGTEQTRLAGETPEPTYDRLPDLRVLGQLHDTYLVCEGEDGLVLVDQHAADERINYERLREALSGEVTAQSLAEPVRVELTPREAALFEAHGEALARLGFHAGLLDGATADTDTGGAAVAEPDTGSSGSDGSADGGRILEVGTVPAALAGSEAPELVRDVLTAFVSGEAAAAETVSAAVDDLLADLACYPSVTANSSLAEGPVLALLEALDGCENPYACPHGRPTLIEFSADELDERFERDYPGHGQDVGHT